MKKFIPALVLLYICSDKLLVAQVTFQKEFSFQNSTPVFNSVKQTADGGYIFAGGSSSTNNHDGVFLMKTNALGDTTWTKSFGATSGTQNSQAARSVIQTTDGGYFAGGYTQAFHPQFDFSVIRTNGFGDTLWTRTLSHPGGASDYCYSVLQANDGNFITFGRQGLFEVDYFLTKWDPAGNILWSKSYSIPGNHDFGNSVVETVDKGFVLSGTSQTGGVGDILIIRTDSSGYISWSKTYTGPSEDECNEVIELHDGGLAIAGSTQSYGSGYYDMFLIRTNSIGDTLWTRTFGTGGFDVCKAILETPDHGFILLAETFVSSLFTIQMSVVRLDSTGNGVWSNNYGFPTGGESNEIINTSDGGFLACGTSYNLGYGAYVVKMDGAGSSGCNEYAIQYNKGHATFQVATVTPAISSYALVGRTPNVAGSGAMVFDYCLDTGTPVNTYGDALITVSPNPSNGNFVIRFPGFVENGFVKIYDPHGKKISEGPVHQSLSKEINISYTSSGIYFISIFDGVNYSNQRIMKQQD